MTIIYQLLFIFSSIIFYWFNLHVLSLFMGLLLSSYLYFVSILWFIIRFPLHYKYYFSFILLSSTAGLHSIIFSLSILTRGYSIYIIFYLTYLLFILHYIYYHLYLLFYGSYFFYLISCQISLLFFYLPCNFLISLYKIAWWLLSFYYLFYFS